MSFRYGRSRATEPLFYRAPHPRGYQPYEYQYAGAEYALARDHCLIGDEPGLGKTIQAVLISNAIEAERTLVIPPASLRLNWEREVRRWSTIEDVLTYPILKGKDGVSDQHHYVIVSYDLLRNRGIFDALMAQRWDHLILDEGHYLKDPKGNTRTRMICAPDGIQSVCGRITMLSGTIMPNQPIEVYNAMRLLDWNSIDRMSTDVFRRAYYELGEGFVTITKGGRTETKWSNRVRNVPTNLVDLQDRLRTNIMVRRSKSLVMPQLPPKQWHPFPIEHTAAINKVLRSEGWKKAEKLYALGSANFSTSAPIDGAISTARRELGEAKAPLVAKYIDDLLDSGVFKVIVAGWHHTVLDYLKEHLAPYGLVYMDGRTSTVKKQAAVDAFQNRDNVRIILGQMKPLGMGWNLSAAQDVVIAELDWVPGNMDQMLDRPHRPGQEGSYVLGHVPVVVGTLEEKMLGDAVTKDENIHEALDRE